MATSLPRRYLTPWLLLLAATLAVMILGGDQWIQGLIHDWRQGEPAKAWARAAYWAGLGGVQAGLLAGLALLAWLRHWPPPHLRAGLTGLLSVPIAGVLVQVVKHLVGRPRPRMALSAYDYFGPTLQTDLLSFPSGHATTSFAVAAVLSVFYPRQAWLFYLLAGLIALGRVVGHAHYLSDVLAGALLGLAVGWPVGWLAAARAGRRS